MRRLWISLIAGLAIAAAEARAESFQVARKAFQSGDYVAAAAAGEAADEPRSLTIAARAWLAHGMLEAEGEAALAAAHRAEAAAREALERAPESVEARLQLALALGVIGRRASAAEAIRAGYAREGRRLIEQAIARAPNEPWAHALLGAWHLEVLRRGGSAGALYYGARFSEGIAAFDRALYAAKGEPAIPLLYAVALLELDADAHAARAADLLAKAAATPATDAFSKEMREEARRFGALLAAEGPQAAAARAAERFG